MIGLIWPYMVANVRSGAISRARGRRMAASIGEGWQMSVDVCDEVGKRLLAEDPATGAGSTRARGLEIFAAVCAERGIRWEGGR